MAWTNTEYKGRRKMEEGEEDKALGGTHYSREVYLGRYLCYPDAVSKCREQQDEFHNW